MRMCLASAEWSGDAPTCERKHFMFTSMHYCHAKTLLSRTQLSIVVILMILRMDRSASLEPHLVPELPTPATEDLNWLEAGGECVWLVGNGWVTHLLVNVSA